MCLQNSVEYILDTSVTWADFEKNIRAALATDARLGAGKSAVDIGDGNGYNSCCALITCDWVGAGDGEELPRRVVLKMPSSTGLRRLKESMPDGQKMFDYTDEEWEVMEYAINRVHNREIAAYEFLEEFNCRTIPKKYFGKRVEDGNRASGQLCLGYIENSKMMSFHEKHSVEQIARALGQIQACSLKKEVTDIVLQKDFFLNLANIFSFEVYEGVFKGILATDNFENTKCLIEKIHALLPKYYGANLASTMHTQMGFRPVLVNADLHTGNVLIDKDTGDLAALIDWQGTHIGVGVEDLHRIAISALTTEDRRASMPMLVGEMYSSFVENLDGAEPPYSLDTLRLLSDLIFPHCALYFATVFIALIEDKKSDISDEERKKRKEIGLAKIIGCLEDVIDLDAKNEKQIGKLKFNFIMSAKLIIALLLIAIVAVQIESIRVQQCDEVCPRIPRERDECCKANGHPGGMDGGLCFFGLAFCKD